MTNDAHWGCPRCLKYCSVHKDGNSHCCGLPADPSVTGILNIISKPALIPWAVKMEREAIRAALLDLVTGRAFMFADKPDWLWAELEQRLVDHKAAEKEKNKAAEIGSAAHALIEWHTKRMLGFDLPADPPEAPEPAQWALMAWQDWARKVNFKPVKAEFVVYSTQHGYIGTGDTLAEVEDLLTLVDYKTGKKVWREAHLQNVAYRAAYAEQNDLPSYAWPRGLILRLPKVIGDPEFEPVAVTGGPDDLPAFLGAKQLWAWMRD